MPCQHRKRTNCPGSGVATAPCSNCALCSPAPRPHACGCIFLLRDKMQIGIDQDFVGPHIQSRRWGTTEAPIGTRAVLLIMAEARTQHRLLAAAEECGCPVFTNSLGHGQMEAITAGMEPLLPSTRNRLSSKYTSRPKAWAAVAQSALFTSQRRGTPVRDCGLDTSAIGKIPTELLQQTFKVVLEAPREFGHNIATAVDSIPAEEWSSCESQPVAFHRLTIVLCYFHAVCTSRRGYGVMGWNMTYPFSSNDLRIAVATASRILDRGSGHLDIKGLQYMIGEIIWSHIADRATGKLYSITRTDS